jgi:hypothetical protein
MYRKFILLTLLSLVLAVLSALPARAQYTDYKANPSQSLLFSIMFDRATFGYLITKDGDTNQFMFNMAAIEVKGSTVTADGRMLLDADGLHVNDTLYRFSDVDDITVERQGDYTVLCFYTGADNTSRAGRTRRGNIIDPFQNIIVPEKEFVRGVVFSVLHDVEVLGEVNKDVISLFGDITIGDAAVVRGDVVTVTGRVRLSGDAAVYGAVYSGSDDRLGRRHRYRRFRSAYREFVTISSPDTLFRYNRVDGLSLGAMVKFADPDSVLPSAWAGGGYAFESERWRYELGLEQTLLRHPALAIGGKAFRLLESDDDWLLSNSENTAFALFAREDYKDYYEAEGGSLWLRVAPLRKLNIETGVRYEETKWLDAQPNLWSLFAGEDKFAPNFGRVDSAARVVGINKIDSAANASFYTQISYDTRDTEDPFYRSGWAANIVLEKSSPDLDSDYDYTRYRLTATRYQRVTHRTMLILRGVYGGSDGLLPMHRRFYLGGLGTLYGYKHKEFSGSYLWMGNAEYRIDFPHSDFAASLMWDVGQTAESSSFTGSDVKHSLGVSMYVGSDLKIGLAKRLDRSYDDDPKLFARLSFSM